MTVVTYKEIRAWGVANGYKCRTGKLGQGVVAAYSMEHPDAVIADLPDDEAVHLTVVEAPAEEETVAGDEFSVAVVIAGCDTTDIQNHLVEALWAAFQQGRAAERRDMLTQLGGTA